MALVFAARVGLPEDMASRRSLSVTISQVVEAGFENLATLSSLPYRLMDVALHSIAQVQTELAEEH